VADGCVRQHGGGIAGCCATLKEDSLVGDVAVAAREIAELIVEDVQVGKGRLDVNPAGVQKAEILNSRCLRARIVEVAIAI
jgi:hypothetical protein